MGYGGLYGCLYRMVGIYYTLVVNLGKNEDDGDIGDIYQGTYRSVIKSVIEIENPSRKQI